MSDYLLIIDKKIKYPREFYSHCRLNLVAIIDLAMPLANPQDVGLP